LLSEPLEEDKQLKSDKGKGLLLFLTTLRWVWLA